MILSQCTWKLRNWEIRKLFLQFTVGNPISLYNLLQRTIKYRYEGMSLYYYTQVTIYIGPTLVSCWHHWQINIGNWVTNVGPMMELNWQNDGRLPMMGQYINIIGNKIK